ncbi:MAG: type II toxin-antitoxin system Phd/YefM family antitoxin [bacterium]
MKTLTSNQAQIRLASLLEETAVSHEPIQITSKNFNGILISEEDWRGIQETIYLTSIPGMKDAITEGLKTPVSECDKELGW